MSKRIVFIDSRVADPETLIDEHGTGIGLRLRNEEIDVLNA